jgi:hypothetical protein
MNRRPTEPGKPAVRVRLDGRDKLPSQNRLAVKLKAASKAAENRPAREATQKDLDRHMYRQGLEQDAMDGFTDTTRMRYMDGGQVSGYSKGGAAAATAVKKHERNLHKGETPTKLAKGGAAPVKKAMGGALPMAAKKRGVPVASREPMIKR